MPAGGKWEKLIGSFSDDYVQEDVKNNLTDKLLPGKLEKDGVNKLQFQQKLSNKVEIKNEQNVWEIPRNKGRRLLMEKVMSGMSFIALNYGKNINS